MAMGIGSRFGRPRGLMGMVFLLVASGLGLLGWVVTVFLWISPSSSSIPNDRIEPF